MGSSEALTFPRALPAQARKNGAFPAVREKNLGTWQTWTWCEVADQVRDLACGLAAVGLKRGATASSSDEIASSSVSMRR